MVTNMEEIKTTEEVKTSPDAETSPETKTSPEVEISREAETSPEAEAEKAEPAMTPEEINASNAAMSTGAIRDDGQGAAFFTAADVRAMSREQVRRNLKKIIRSMESPDF